MCVCVVEDVCSRMYSNIVQVMFCLFLVFVCLTTSSPAYVSVRAYVCE